MPEGHTIHRAARLQRAALAGHTLAVDSPQGRFAAGAALLDGRVLRDVEAYGKHLLYHWEHGQILHVHLGLYGAFRMLPRARSASGAPEPLPPVSAGTRLRIVAADTVLQLAGPTVCELIDPSARERLVARLGPDPLRRDADPDRAWRALQRRTVAIGAALLDQKVLCGVGNVFRAESLFLERVHPERPSRALTREQFDDLWATLVRALRRGERAGRIVTVEPADVGVATRSRVPAGERFYVYKRAGLACRRCATPIRASVSALRSMYACPTCQAN